MKLLDQNITMILTYWFDTTFFLFHTIGFMPVINHMFLSNN